MNIDFNRTIVECRSKAMFGVGIADGILIEPQWNVDGESVEYHTVHRNILIEPQWNVDKLNSIEHD